MEFILENSRRLSLDPQVIITLISGRDLLKDRISKIVTGLPEEMRETTLQSCLSAAKPCCKVAHFIGLELVCNTSDLQDINGKRFTSSFLKRACEHCATHMGKSIDKRREQIWNVLPSFFDLRYWEDLKEDLAKLS